MRARVLFFVVLLAQVPTMARASDLAPKPSTPELVVVSEDPYTNPGSYHRTEVEPDTAAFGSTIVATFQEGRFPDLGASNIGWAVSTNAGQTWTDASLPGTTVRADPPGSFSKVSDPVVAYDAKHDTWLIVGIDSPLHHTVFVSRSADGARTFSDPVIVRKSERRNFDKPWITCDTFPSSPYYGNCYAAWNDDDHHGRLLASTSSDGGATWAKTLTPKETCVFGVQPVVQPSGRVVMPLHSYCPPDGRRSFISTDGGESFIGPFGMPQGNERWMAGGLRSDGVMLISADVDADGTVYAAFSDCTLRSAERRCSHNDIMITTSEDGQTWSDMERVPIDPVTSSVDHFFPSIALDPSTSGGSAHIGLVYYFYPEQRCDVETCRLNVGFVSSTDGGSAWTAPVQLAGPFENTWFPHTDSGYMVGEYVGISFVDGNAIPVFPVAVEGFCELGDVTSCDVSTASVTIPVG